MSALGQPLQAEVELLSVTREELASLTAQFASADAYRQANLQYSGAIAGLKVSVEKRANGQPYLRITSTRPVNEPFLDLLVELTWSSGRLVREYTALLDPPGFGTSPLSAPPPVAAPEVSPAPPPPVAAAPIEPPPAPALSAPATPGSYGPIRRGETMGRIADDLKPEGVTLEQMLIALFRNNRDAFIRDNLNLVREGKILRVPEREEVAAIPHSEAVKEFRTQVADWNAYRQRLAEAAGLAPEARGSASGKITTRVEDATPGETKDVVKLSKGEPPGAAAGAGDAKMSAADRIRTLEEEVVAREKALGEANERIAQLEKTIKDMRRLAEIKSPTLAAAQQQAAAKPETPADTMARAPEQAAQEKPPVTAPEAAAPPKPKPKPRVVQPPPPPPEPALMDIVMENLPLIGGGAVVLLGGAYFGLARRRRSRVAQLNDVATAGAAPTLGDAVEAPGAGFEPAAEARPSGDEVDPIQDAEVYIAYGRDAQAEEILKEALAKEPTRQDIQVKLLEIYSARKDKGTFNRMAQGLNSATGGQGDNWLRVAAMGFALDPDNPLYASGRDMAASMPPGGQPAPDFDFNLEPAGEPTTDITFDEMPTPKPEESTVVETALREAAQQAEGAADVAIDEPRAGLTSTDISFEVPEAGSPTRTDIDIETGEAEKKAADNTIDFNIELPSLEDAPTESSAPESQPGTDSGMDFKLDLGDLNLNLDEKGGAAAGPDREKDSQWYDVQTKFDLAKAYQEMGDKDGAKEILQEVVKEGDGEQQAEAKKLLETLG